MEGYTEKRASSELEAESEALATSLKGWVFVVNPASGSGSTGKKFPKMLERFKAAAASKSWRDIGRLWMRDRASVLARAWRIDFSVHARRRREGGDDDGTQ